MIFVLTSCANDEKIIRDGLTAELDQFTDPNSALWDEITSDAGNDLSELGIGTQDLIGAWTESFSYEIGAITVEGDTAQAKITITCKQLSAAVTTATDIIISDPSLGQMTETELRERTGEVILDELRKSTPATTEITIPCTKSGNEWSEGTAATDEYARALLGS
jgi:hypothetical protein